METQPTFMFLLMVGGLQYPVSDKAKFSFHVTYKCEYPNL